MVSAISGLLPCVSKTLGPVYIRIHVHWVRRGCAKVMGPLWRGDSTAARSGPLRAARPSDSGPERMAALGRDQPPLWPTAIRIRLRMEYLIRSLYRVCMCVRRRHLPLPSRLIASCGPLTTHWRRSLHTAAPRRHHVCTVRLSVSHPPHPGLRGWIARRARLLPS